jgi:hypothetical protein
VGWLPPVYALTNRNTLMSRTPCWCCRSKSSEPQAPSSSVVASLWCMNFKGYFSTGDGTRCDPFTITDAHSRYLIVSDGLADGFRSCKSSLRSGHA